MDIGDAATTETVKEFVVGVNDTFNVKTTIWNHGDEPGYQIKLTLSAPMELEIKTSDAPQCKKKNKTKENREVSERYAFILILF